MATRKGAPRRPQNPAAVTKGIIYTTDTSGTMPSNRPRRIASTQISLEDFPSNEKYDLENRVETTAENRKSSGFTAWNWILSHWEVPTSILGLAALVLVFATRLDSKVDVLAGDVKDVKGTVEKLNTESTRVATEVGQVQKSVSRLEDQKLRSKY